ncbi:MAG: hypothetical protein ACRD0A_07030 [Acidimicrobiales bacterium]
MKDECQARGLEPIVMARVGVNKAADQFVRADEIRPRATAGPRLRDEPTTDDENQPADVATWALGAARRAHPTPRIRRSPNAAERLHRAEAGLDAARAASYDRFARGVTTAREMNVERNKLIRALNRLVRAENIRYRSRLRTEFPADG